MEQKKNFTEAELRNEVKNLMETDLAGTKMTLFVILPILIVVLALLFFISSLFKVTDMIALGVVIVCAIIVVWLWHRNLKSIDADKDSFADLARKLKNVKCWNRIYNCSMPLACFFVIIFSNILEFGGISWHWGFIIALIVFVGLLFFSWKVFENSMKQKYDVLISNLEEAK